MTSSSWRTPPVIVTIVGIIVAAAVAIGIAIWESHVPPATSTTSTTPDSRPDGTALLPTSPASSTPTSTTPSKLTTTPPPPLVSLADLTAVTGTPYTEAATLDGTSYPHPVRMNFDAYEIYTLEYNLEAKYKCFTSKTGFVDGYQSGWKWHFTLVSISAGQPKTLEDAVLAGSQLHNFKVPVAGVKRFQLVIKLAQESPLSAFPETDYPAIWANPTLSSRPCS